MLQSHYSSTLDFSNEALNAAEKGYRKLSNALKTLKTIEYAGPQNADKVLEDELSRLNSELYENMSDDFNTAKTLAVLFEMSARINDFKSGNQKIGSVAKEIFEQFKRNYIGFMEDVLGLKEEAAQNDQLLDGVINVLIELRKKARVDKNYALSDRIRDDLKQIGVQLKDGKNGEITWSVAEN